MTDEEIKDLHDAVIEAAKCIVKGLEELGKAVYEAVTAACESVYEAFTAFDAQKLIEQINQALKSKCQNMIRISVISNI